MNKLINYAAKSVLISLPLLSSCSSIATVDEANRDTTAAYEGVWIGKVDKPRASKEILPGNWTINCEWDPFDIYLMVDNGTIQLGGVEDKSFISESGDFRIAITGGMTGMVGGVMPGTPKNITVFDGNLAGEKPNGRYSHEITTFGSSGCSASIMYSRYKPEST